MGRYLTKHATNEEVIAEIFRDAIDDLRAFNKKRQEMTTESPEVYYTFSEIADTIVAVLSRPEFMNSNDETRATCVRVFEAFTVALPPRCVECGGPICLPHSTTMTQ